MSLKIVVPGGELFNNSTNEFVSSKETTLLLEHSLLSLSKWESTWNVPFLSSKKSVGQVVDYVRCMTITQNVDPSVYLFLSNENIEAVTSYINSPMTATTIYEEPNAPKSREIITAELIYYWMIAYNIPFECQKWHLNRLLTLIRVCGIKNAPEKKIPMSERMSRNRALNEARKAKYKTKG